MADRVRTQDCDRTDALSRLEQAEAFIRVADLVVDAEDDGISTAGVAAALSVLAGIAATDAACCARLKQRARGKDHKQALALVESVHPSGPDMARDLKRLLDRKDEAQYGLHMVGTGDAKKMVEWAKRLLANARAALEAG